MLRSGHEHPGTPRTVRAALALVFAASALAGARDRPRAEGRPRSRRTRRGEPAAHEGGGAAEHGAAPTTCAGSRAPLTGCASSSRTRSSAAASSERLAFRVVDDRGSTVRDFDVEHTKRMHLILARRDLTGFQHLHPEQRADGTWETRVRIPDAGSYRLFADFTRDGEPQTLAGDLRVDGAADLRALPAPAPTAASDGGYDIELAAAGARPGEEADLRFRIRKDGEPVASEEYLGAGGHLVALREGDLAFLHVHPTNEAGSSEIGFGATFPTAGRYRLFLQFQHDGAVQTAAFTQEVR